MMVPKQDDKQVERILAIMREENPDMTDQEFDELAQGILEMGAIAYQKTQEGKIFVSDESGRTH